MEYSVDKAIQNFKNGKIQEGDLEAFRFVKELLESNDLQEATTNVLLVYGFRVEVFNKERESEFTKFYTNEQYPKLIEYSENDARIFNLTQIETILYQDAVWMVNHMKHINKNDVNIDSLPMPNEDKIQEFREFFISKGLPVPEKLTWIAVEEYSVL